MSETRDPTTAALIDMLADCVVKSTEYGAQDGGFVANYLLPTGPIHRAIPLLQELGVTVRPGFDGRSPAVREAAGQVSSDLPEYIRKARAEAEGKYPPHVIEAGGPDHYAAGQAQALCYAILAADWDTVREVAADPYTHGDDVDAAKGALAGACQPLTVGQP